MTRILASVCLLGSLVGGCASDAGEANDGDDDPALDTIESDLATGCTTAYPTSIGGAIYGYPDNDSIDATIGVQLVDSSGRSLDTSGSPCSAALNNCNGSSNYALLVHANPTLGPLGEPASVAGAKRSWSHCVSSKIVAMYLEGYPRNATGVTDETKYAETMSNRVDIVPGSTVRYAMRFPIRYEYSSSLGNTGNVNGWATCNGAPTKLTRINAWTAQPSTACGIRAYQSGGRIGQTNGYWWVGPLAAGQCNASSQPVNIVAHVTCNGVDMHQTKQVGIVRGKTIGAVSFHFP